MVLLALYDNDKVTLRKLIERTKSSTAPVNNTVKRSGDWLKRLRRLEAFLRGDISN
ncbi:hypothetical protein IC006_1062 [Sulfuracidifex tepidarius]|uniref:Uncharacterized protein n=1 Tax=Sulfuracidifex tepidarius TaxID=1294262 RepID=A0A510E1Z3_9CREN|nr:hypothetical protein IC006_1062 [Sulfuracidifex tepidarius]BBG26521.1 hypothetical protein IC007_1035 [Sulfuracidifex tepidarius]